MHVVEVLLVRDGRGNDCRKVLALPMLRESAPGSSYMSVPTHAIRQSIIDIMSQHALRIPLRNVASKSLKAQWICQRCLATQAQPSTVYQRLPTADLLSRQLPQRKLPDQYLSHVNAETLPISEQEQWEKVAPHKKIVGVVVSHGKMDKTVRVRVAGQRWNNKIKKVG